MHHGALICAPRPESTHNRVAAPPAADRCESAAHVTRDRLPSLRRGLRPSSIRSGCGRGTARPCWQRARSPPPLAGSLRADQGVFRPARASSNEPPARSAARLRTTTRRASRVLAVLVTRIAVPARSQDTPRADRQPNRRRSRAAPPTTPLAIAARGPRGQGRARPLRLTPRRLPLHTRERRAIGPPLAPTGPLSRRPRTPPPTAASRIAATTETRQPFGEVCFQLKA